VQREVHGDDDDGDGDDDIPEEIVVKPRTPDNRN
jgi:hypothetical protein